MQAAKMLSIALVASLGLVSVATAQSARDPAPPAELPPSSYQGEQFVDSTGCVYIRAGLNGTVAWVPRVTRQRRQICGQTPTPFGAAARAPSQSQQAASGASQPAAAALVRAQPVAAARPVASRASVAPLVIPQGFAQVAPGSARIAPTHVVKASASGTDFSIPKGYIKAWNDDRLNPHRAVGTVQGWRAMNRAWTQTLPRQIVVPEAQDATLITRGAQASHRPKLAGNR